jgi:hypothetical protein
VKIPIHSASATTSCPNGIKDAHSQKKEKRNTEKEKSRYRDRKLETTILTPPEDQLLHKRCLQEGNSAQTLLSPDHRS